MNTATERVIKAFGVMLEVTGSEMSKGAMRVMLHELAKHPEGQVVRALDRCCRELKGPKIALQDILTRIDDGRPDPETAWTMVPKDEMVSAMMTEEMGEAFSLVYSTVASGELIPARMAFLEAYRKAVQLAREEKKPVRWAFTPGTDLNGREAVLLDAADKGLISAERVQELLPHHRDDVVLTYRLQKIMDPTVKALTAPPKRELSDAGKKALEDMRAIVGAKR